MGEHETPSVGFDERSGQCQANAGARALTTSKDSFARRWVECVAFIGDVDCCASGYASSCDNHGTAAMSDRIPQEHIEYLAARC